jgi:hypothetical protein
MVRTVAPRIDTGLLVELDKWRRGCAKPLLIIFNMFLMVRHPGRKAKMPTRLTTMPPRPYSGTLASISLPSCL